jgi:hypothetical protein
VKERFALTGVCLEESRFELIGVDALHGAARSTARCDPYEVRVRVAGRCATREEAERIGNEVEALYTNGPAGGGGAQKRTSEIIGIASVLIPRDRVHPEVQFLGRVDI